MIDLHNIHQSTLTNKMTFTGTNFVIGTGWHSPSRCGCTTVRWLFSFSFSAHRRVARFPFLVLSPIVPLWLALGFFLFDWCGHLLLARGVMHFIWVQRRSQTAPSLVWRPPFLSLPAVFRSLLLQAVPCPYYTTQNKYSRFFDAGLSRNKFVFPAIIVQESKTGVSGPCAAVASPVEVNVGTIVLQAQGFFNFRVKFLQTGH